MLRVTPIAGSRFSEFGPAEAPSCTLLEFSGVSVLMNVGQLNPDQPLPPHDCVFLTDSTFQSVGGLAQYFHQQNTLNNGWVPPIYATFPTVKMGQMTLYDHHAAVCMDGGTPEYSLENVDDVFSSITAIKYSQTVHVGGLNVVAHRASHVVGGAFYVLQRTLDETVVVMAETYHMSRELHLDSSTLLQHAATPDVLICRPGGPAFWQIKSLNLPPTLVSAAQRNVTETVLAAMRRDGNVLLPVDCAGRVLELVLLLNTVWEKQRLGAAYNLVWLAPMCTNVCDFARSQLEWMNKKLGTQFDCGGGHHPYALKCVKFCTSVPELQQVLQDTQNNPTCVLASGLDLERGPARDIFLQWAGDPDNAVVFTDSSQAYLRKKATTIRPPSSTASAVAGEDEVTSSSLPAIAMPASMERGTSTSATTAVTTAPTVSVVAAPPAATAIVPDDDPDGVGQEGDGVLVGETLTEASPWTSAGQLLMAWATAKARGQEMDDIIVIDVNVPIKAPLAGAELKEFLAQEDAARLQLARAEEKRRMLAQVELAKGELHLGEEEEAKAVTTNTANATTAAVATTAKSTRRPKKKSRFDSTLFLKFSKPLHLTFEVREEAVGIGQADSTAKYGLGESAGRSGDVVEDDYGISVQAERFTDIVSGVDPSKFAGGSGRIGDEVTRRGFGYGVDGKPKTALSGKGSARLISEDEGNDDEDEFDEQALEAVDLSEGKGIIRGRNGRPPMKVSTVPRKFEVLAEVSFVPGLEGRADARAARQSVRALQPREVIVLGGTQTAKDESESKSLVTDEVRLLADATKSFATGSKNVLTPSDGETAELAVGHAAYGARLIDTPYLTAEEKEAADEPSEPIEPFEAKLGACNVSFVDCLATGQKVALDGSIVLAPRQQSSSSEMPSIYLSDGEVLLTDLRVELIASGMKAEYSAHAGYSQLIVNGKIVVRKEHHDDSGRMQVEGPLCEDFYTVRSIVCGQYVTL